MKRDELVENIILILCIPALWPVVRVMRGAGSLPNNYDFYLGFIVVVLIVITVRRIRRIRAAFRETGRRPRSPY
jgi:hypothetical protein